MPDFTYCRICLLTAVATLIAITAASTVDPFAAPLLPFSVGWPVLTLLFVFAEFAMVRLHFWSEAHEFNLTDAPLLLGVFVAPPIVVLTASLTANLLWKLARHQTPLKVAFNLAVGAVEVTVAVAVTRALVGPSEVFSPAHWAAGLGAILMSSVASSILVAAVIGIAQGRFDGRDAGRSMGLSAVFSSTTASITLGAIAVVSVQPVAAVLLLPTLAIAFASSRAYTRALDESGRLELVARLATAMAAADDGERSLRELLRLVGSELGADTTELVVLADPGGDELRVRMARAGGHWDVQIDIDATHREAITTHLRDHGDAERWSAADAAHPLAGYYGDRGIRDAVVAPLVTEHGPIGLLTIANRVGDAATWSEADRQLGMLIGHHVAAALRSAGLQRALGELAAEREMIVAESRHDSLTGLANRRGLDAAVETWDDDDRDAVVYIDLDDFKRVNDTHGHAVGDALLTEVGVRLSSVIRPGDVAARVGGDEFVLLLRSVDDPQTLDDITLRIERALASPVDAGGVSIRPSASIGAVRSAASGPDIRRLVPLADAAMYEAKSGRSCRRSAPPTPR